MANPVAEIEKILTEELQIYTELYNLEERKSGAIADKDGKLMEKICGQQETLVSRVSRLEEHRVKSINRFAGIGGQVNLPGAASLKDIAPLMDADSSTRIMNKGMELKKLLVRLDSLFQTNNSMIRDNLDFFDMLLSGLRSSAAVTTGYNEKGVDKGRATDSLLFNKTV